MKTPRREIIVEIGAEGGSITLVGVRSGAGWRYQTSGVDWTPELLDEKRVQHESDPVQSWEAALRLLDNYPWHALVPVHVHPEFRGRIWAAVQKRFDDHPRASSGLDRWREFCERT
jgi:hypothetical protein